MNSEIRFCISVKEYEVYCNFYSNILKWSIFNTWNRGIGHRGTIFKLKSFLLEILDCSKDREESKVNDTFYLYIEVEDILKLFNQLKTINYKTTEIETTSWGHMSFYIKDPIGLKLKFFQKIYS